MRPTNTPRGRDAAFVLVAVLWSGVAMMMLALATTTLAWMNWSGARHEASTIAARADAEGAVLRFEAALVERARVGDVRPTEPPPVPEVDGVSARVITFRWLDARTVEYEIEVTRPPARVIVGGRWSVP